jgi:hypothetical protein
VSGPLLQYSPGQRRKKKAMRARSVTARWWAVAWLSWATVSCMWTRSWRGTGGRWVLFVVRAELAVEAEVGFAEVIVAGVLGPHAGKDLGQGAKVLLHGPLAYWTAVSGKLANADLVGEHLEERDGILDAVEGWIKTEVEAEGAPLAPVGPIGGCAAGMDASGNLVLAKAVDSPCRCCNVRRSIVQDVAWGKHGQTRSRVVSR